MSIQHWISTLGAAGQRRFVAPDGRDYGWIEVRDRVSPLVPFRELLERRHHLLRTEGATAVVVEPARRIVTAEGEHAVMATICGELAGSVIEHGLGVIYADDYQIEVDGRATHVDRRAEVRELVAELLVNLPLGLGEQRYRRYLYRQPAGWRGIARGLVTTWYPDPSAWIKVLPARPTRMPAVTSQLFSLVHDDSFASFQAEGKIVRDDADFGPFTCVVTRAIGRFADAIHDRERRMLITAGLVDDRFIYGLRLDSGERDAADHERTFLEVLKSVMPVPMRAPPQVSEAFDHWLE